jgi:hypothetical protein
MIKNPLEKWERPGQKNGGEKQAPPELVKDVAPAPEKHEQEEELKDPTRYRLHSLELRPVGQMWANPSYAELIDVLDDGKNPTMLVLWFSRQVIVIKGRPEALKIIIAGLRQRTQWVIEQHDKQNGPPSKNTSKVESMEFFYENLPALIAKFRADIKC